MSCPYKTAFRGNPAKYAAIHRSALARVSA
jgi:hypothetical protein